MLVRVRTGETARRKKIKLREMSQFIKLCLNVGERKDEADSSSGCGNDSQIFVQKARLIIVSSVLFEYAIP